MQPPPRLGTRQHQHPEVPEVLPGTSASKTPRPWLRHHCLVVFVLSFHLNGTIVYLFFGVHPLFFNITCERLDCVLEGRWRSFIFISKQCFFVYKDLNLFIRSVLNGYSSLQLLGHSLVCWCCGLRICSPHGNPFLSFLGPHFKNSVQLFVLLRTTCTPMMKISSVSWRKFRDLFIPKIFFSKSCSWCAFFIAH